MRRSVARCRKGATAIEYALIASLLGVGIVGGTQLLGDNVNGTFCAVAGKMADVVGFKGTCGSGSPTEPEPAPPPMNLSWSVSVNAGEDRCQYNFNYSSSVFDIDNTAPNQGSCGSTLGPDSMYYAGNRPPQENIDEWAKGGRDPYGVKG